MIGAVRSELRKVLSTRLWWGLLTGLAVTAALLAWAMAALATSSAATVDAEGTPTSLDWSPFSAIGAYHGGVNLIGLTLLFPLALGIVLMTSEFRHRTLSATVLATPNRWTVIGAKMVVALVFGALYGVVHVLAGIAGASLTIVPRHLPYFLTDRDVLTSFGVVVLALALWALLGTGLGALVRNQVAAVMVGLGAAFVLQVAVNPLFYVKDWVWAYRLLPGNLTTNMLMLTRPQDDPGGAFAESAEFMFDQWWVAALILLGYALVMAAAGALVTSRRDIS